MVVRRRRDTLKTVDRDLMGNCEAGDGDHTRSLITFVIPVLAEPQRIARALLLAEEGRPKARSSEFIIVIDGSEDLLPTATTSRLHDNVRVISTGSSRGPGAARNAGLSACQTPFLAFIDDDDLPEFQRYAALSASMEGSEADVLVAGCTLTTVDGFGERFYGPSQGRSRGSLNEHLWKIAGVWRCIFRTRYLLDHNVTFPNLSFGEDLVFLLELDACGPRVQESDVVIYRHMLRGASTSGSIGSRGRDPIMVLESLRSAGYDGEPLRRKLVRLLWSLKIHGRLWIEGTWAQRAASARQLMPGA